LANATGITDVLPVIMLSYIVIVKCSASDKYWKKSSQKYITSSETDKQASKQWP